MNSKFKPSKKFIILQNFLRVIVLLTLGFGVYYAIYFFSGKELNYFLKTFGLGIILILVGIVAFGLSILNKYGPGTENKGDKLMLFIGACLVIFGIGTIIFNFF